MAKIVFFQAHPDDLEHKCGHVMHYLATKSKKKHVIKIASITKGEFGLPGAQYDKFKGDFLAKVRTRELFKAESIHGIPPENIEFFGFVDGLVKFNKDLVDKVANYLKKEKPDVVFAPEPIYTWYYHMDHVNTGRAVFYAIYHKLIDFTPNLYFYTALNPNYYFGFNKEEIALTYQLLACHKTQYWLFNYTLIPYRPFTRFHGRKLPGWKHAEAFRRVYFKKENLNKNNPSLIVRIFSHFFFSMPWFKAKYPQEILNQLRSKNSK